MKGLRKSPRSRYIDLVTLTGANLLQGELAPRVLESLGHVAEQAAADWHLSPRDVDIVQECVDSWVRFIRFKEDNDGHGQRSAQVGVSAQ